MLAYRTMADMYSREFAENWKTWTGVRLINQTMPKHIDIRKIEFYRNLKGNSTAFHYVLLMEIGNLVVSAIDKMTLNINNFSRTLTKF